MNILFHPNIVQQFDSSETIYLIFSSYGFASRVVALNNHTKSREITRRKTANIDTLAAATNNNGGFEPFNNLVGG